MYGSGGQPYIWPNLVYRDATGHVRVVDMLDTNEYLDVFFLKQIHTVSNVMSYKQGWPEPYMYAVYHI
jgi:hypothetical protein